MSFLFFSDKIGSRRQTAKSSKIRKFLSRQCSRRDREGLLTYAKVSRHTGPEGFFLEGSPFGIESICLGLPSPHCSHPRHRSGRGLCQLRNPTVEFLPFSRSSFEGVKQSIKRMKCRRKKNQQSAAECQTFLVRIVSENSYGYKRRPRWKHVGVYDMFASAQNWRKRQIFSCVLGVSPANTDEKKRHSQRIDK